MGTRLRPFTLTNPKPLYPIAGKPFIEYLVRQIISFGIKEVVILLGYMPEKIKRYLGNGERYNISIKYVVTDVNYETEYRLSAARDILDDCFLLMYCDNYCPIDFEKLKSDFVTNNALIQITAYANKDGYTKNNIYVDDAGRMTVYDKKRIVDGLNAVDIGYALLDKNTLDYIDKKNNNFEAIVYPQLVEQDKAFATVTEHRYYSIGSTERIELTEKFFSAKKVVFIDRDGTLNIKPPKACYVETPEEFVWLKDAKTAVRKLNDAGFSVFLITNQPGIARGNITVDMLEKIHNKMLADLAEVGAKIDKIYYCPHGWDEGCDCRKPRPGLLYQAQKEYSLNLRQAYLIGDDDRDISAGQAAGCKCFMANEQHTLLDIVNTIVRQSSCFNEL